MATTRADIESWFGGEYYNFHLSLERGKTKPEYMIVVCDTFDYDDYPVYCTREDFAATYAAYNGKNMQKIMEVYDLSKPMVPQLDEYRAFNCPPEFAGRS